MKESQHKIRIKDIARLAGVSEGTVDRVLHSRGEVSAKSAKLVNDALLELDYTPNLIARSLASKKHFHFVAMIPEHKGDDYWESVEKGFDLAEKEFMHYHVSVTVMYYNQYDSSSFGKSAQKVLNENPDAVFIAPVFKNETILFTEKLKQKQILFSFLDSMIENTEFLTYYGQNSAQSGYIGAKLLFDSLPPQAKVMVIRTQRKGENHSNQTFNRYQGFLKYIEEVKSCCFELINVELVDDDDALNQSRLKSSFKMNPDIAGVITFNSKVYRLARYLKKINRQDVLLLGYDLLNENIKYLKQGVVSYLIAQRPEKQAYFTVQDMCNKLIFHKEIQSINYMPIDVLMKENIDYYIQFRD